MTTVVTGASGHLGANLVRALLARGRAVRALVHRDRRALAGLRVETAEGDVRDANSLRRAFEGAEIVYHAAARISLLTTDRALVEAVNVTGTRNVVEACLHCGVRRLIHFSSIHALENEPLDVPINESRPLTKSRCAPPYDQSKAAGEREVRHGIKRGLDGVILYPTAIIGPYDFRPSYFGRALLRMVTGRLPALVPGGFDWVDVRDVVAGALRAEHRAPAGASYILSGHWVSVRDLAGLVEAMTGVPAPRLVCPMWLARIGAPFMAALARLDGNTPLYTSVSLRALGSNRSVSRARATRELDYHPRPFRETLVDTLRWFEEAGQLARPLALSSAEAA